MSEASTKIVVLDGRTLNPGDNPWTELERLGEVVVYEITEDAELVERAREADVVLTNKTRLSEDTLRSLPQLRGICVLATGYDVVDVRAARALKIPVCNVPSYSTESVAQHTLALLLELCHHVGLHDRAVQAGEWVASEDFSFWKRPLLELSGLELGLVGVGAIGARVAKIGAALGMRVIASRKRNDPIPGIELVRLETLFREADVVSLHCPLTEETSGLVDRDRIDSMKRTAFLINTARGGLLNEADVASALREGRLAGVAVDVVSSEPIRADNPLLGAPNCIITPHMAWTSLVARKRLMHVTAENVRAILSGRPQNQV